MSLIRPVLRMTTVAALRGITIAELNVFDTDNTPLNDAVKSVKKPLPYITVYTDEDIRSEIQSKGVLLANREIALIVEIGVKSVVTFKLPNGDVQTEVTVPDSDPGLELSVDLLESQVINVLFGSPRSPWAELFKSMVMKVIRVPSVRGASGAQGARWAARQVTFRLDVIADPPTGSTPDSEHPLFRFIAMAKANAALKIGGAAAVIESALGTPGAPLTNWERDQALLGITRQGIDAIGLAPVAAPLTMPADGSGPMLNEATPEENNEPPTTTVMPNGDIVPDHLFPKG